MRRNRRRRGEAQVHHERWLVSYADFITLLFAFFVVLFASSYRDNKTVQKVSQAIHNGFQTMGAFSGDENHSQVASVSGGLVSSTNRPPEPEKGTAATLTVDVAGLRKELDSGDRRRA